MVACAINAKTYLAFRLYLCKLLFDRARARYYIVRARVRTQVFSSGIGFPYPTC